MSAAEMEAEECIKLLAELTHVLEGGPVVAEAEQHLRLALMLRTLGQFDLAVEEFSDAFSAAPGLMEDRAASHRYAAARAAALAGPAFQDQAITWLQADLAVLDRLCGTEPQEVLRTLESWKTSEDLAAIRDGADLAPRFRQLWTDVAALAERADDDTR